MSPSESSPTPAYLYANGNTNGLNGNGTAYDAFPAEDSPEGATVGISGILDGPFMPRSSQGGFSSPTDALRVSFNTAEADLSFPNLQATQLFNIPEGFEEFLGSALMNGPGPNPPRLPRETSATALSSSMMPHGGGGAAPGMSTMEMSNNIPAFSTLIGPWYVN